MSRSSPLAFALILVLLPTVAGAAITPEEAVKAKQMFDVLYGAAMRRVENTPHWRDDVALGRRILANAQQQSQGNPALLTFMCEAVYELTAERKEGREAALEAMNLLIREVPEKTEQAQARIRQVLEWMFYHDGRPREERMAIGRRLIDMTLLVAERRFRVGADVEDLCRLVKRLARQTRSPRREELDARADRLMRMQKVAREIEQLEGRLSAAPTNAAARRRLAWLLLTEYDDPIRAAQYAPGEAGNLRYLSDAAKPIDQLDPQTMLELGDWYLSLSRGDVSDKAKVNMLQHARAYYTAFLDRHPAQDHLRIRAETGIRTVDDEMARVADVTTTPPTSGSFGPGRWVDVLPLVDPKEHRQKGNWHLRGSVLRIEPIDGGRLQLPVELHGSYELEVSFVRTEGNESVGIILPLGGGNRCMLRLARNDKASGLEMIQGKKAHQNDTTVSPHWLDNGRGYTVTARVSRMDGGRVRVDIEINGRQFTQWQGKASDCRLLGGIDIPNKDAPALFAYNCAVSFRAVRVRMLNGQGKVVD